jgi:hypothetical protein
MRRAGTRRTASTLLGSVLGSGGARRSVVVFCQPPMNAPARRLVRFAVVASCFFAVAWGSSAPVQDTDGASAFSTSLL